MAEPYIGEIRLFPFNFAPVKNWAKCDGQLLNITSHSALFSIIGTTYGGDGRSTFAVPDYRGRTPIQWGGAYWRDFRRGERGGFEQHTLTMPPAHRHTFNVQMVEGDQVDPTNNMLASEVHVKDELTERPFSSNTNTTLHPDMISNAGKSQPEPFTNIQPIQVLNFCIALGGIYPPRS